MALRPFNLLRLLECFTGLFFRIKFLFSHRAAEYLTIISRSGGKYIHWAPTLRGIIVLV